MSQVVEITIDLTNPNRNSMIETFGVVKTGERNIYCKAGDIGRRFFIPNMNEVKYRGFLNYSYRYQTEDTDYREIIESEKTSNAISEIVKYLEKDLNRYQRRLEASDEYYQALLDFY
ncbi:hypothetical protein [Parablautia muri]|uniref:Uncharacterized protein n=1 Tax=Parablautia muri TaxID=2320879 RepID=A0A9X5GST7_9FIRM|nr:hypothetical protein [Parablautia muri]NBJ93220.1 hypothetical protein [Parablautia muri]